MATNDKTVKLTILTDVTQPETVFKKVTDSAKNLETTISKITSTDFTVKGVKQTAVDVEVVTKNLSKFKEVLDTLTTTFGAQSKISYSIAPSKEELQALKDAIALAKLSKQEDLAALRERIALNKLQKQEDLAALRERIAERKLELQVQKETEKFKEESIRLYTAFVESEAKKQAAIVKQNLKAEEEATKASYERRLRDLTAAYADEEALAKAALKAAISSKFALLSGQTGYTPPTPRNFATSSIVAGMSIAGREAAQQAAQQQAIQTSANLISQLAANLNAQQIANTIRYSNSYLDIVLKMSAKVIEAYKKEQQEKIAIIQHGANSEEVYRIQSADRIANILKQKERDLTNLSARARLPQADPLYLNEAQLASQLASVAGNYDKTIKDILAKLTDFAQKKADLLSFDKHSTYIKQSMLEYVNQVKQTAQQSLVALEHGISSDKTIRSKALLESARVEQQLAKDLAKLKKDLDADVISKTDANAAASLLVTTAKRELLALGSIINNIDAKAIELTKTLKRVGEIAKEGDAKLRALANRDTITLANAQYGGGSIQAEEAKLKIGLENLRITKEASLAEINRRAALEASNINFLSAVQAETQATTATNVYNVAVRDLTDKLNKLTLAQIAVNKANENIKVYAANSTDRIKNIEKANQLVLTTIANGANSEKTLRLKYAQEIQEQEEKLAKGLVGIAGSKASASIKETNAKRLTDSVEKELIRLKGLVNAFDVEEAKLGKAKGIQQGVINEFNQRQQLLDKYSKLELSKREQLVRDLLAIEQRKQAQLDAIAKSGASDTQIKAASTASLKQYADAKKALLETANAADEAKSKHLDLSQFILKSMIIWRTYNLVLNETKQLLFAVPRIGMELESTRSILNATMGGVAGTSIALTGLHKEAERTGISVAALRETWRTFSASTTIAGESINTSWKIFSNMNTVITALHYNADRTQHIFLALAQIFNKGKVQSEELVKQLGNLLPGAFAAFAAANNKTTMQLSIDMKKGLVVAHDSILNFTEFYKERFKISFATARLSLNSELGRMNTAFIELGETLYGLSEKGLKEVTKSLASFANGFKDILRDKDTWVTLSKTFEAAYWTSSAVALTMFAGKLQALGGISAAATLALMKVQNAIAAIAAFAKSPLGIAIAVGVGLWYAKEKIAGDGGKPVADAMIRDIEELIKEIKAKDLSIPIDLKINEDAKVLAGRARQTYLNDQQRLVQEDLAYIKSSKIRTAARGAIDPYGVMATERLVAQAAGQLNFPRMSLQGLEDYDEQLKKELGNNVKILNDYKEELKNIDLDKAAKEASELSAKTQESIEKMRLAAMEEGAEKVKKQFEMQNSDDIANIKKNFADAGKAFEAANRDYQKLLIKARQGTGDLLKLSAVGGKDSKIDPIVLAYKDAKEKLDEATKALSDTYVARDMLVSKYNDKIIKKEGEFDDKRLELAKKASEDLLKLTENEASKRAAAIENELKALEQTKDITSTSAYYNAERALIEKQIEIKKELLATTKELLTTSQNVGNTTGTPVTNLDLLNQKQTKSGMLDTLAPAVVSYMMAKGWTKPQAAGIAANLWEESNFKTTIIGDKDNPKGAAHGLGQWRLDRIDTFFKMFGKPILEATMKEQLDYYDWELRNKEKTALQEMLASTSPKEAAAAGVTFERPKDTSGAKARRGGLAGKIFEMSGGVSAASLDALASGESKIAGIEKEIADLEARKKLTYPEQTKALKLVEEAYAKVNAQYLLLTGQIKEGVEEKAAIKYKDAIDAANNSLENGNEFEKARAVIIKQQVAEIEVLTVKQINYQKVLKEISLLQSMNSEKLNQINALEQLGLKGTVEAMLERSDVKKNDLNLLQKELAQLEANPVLPGQANFDAYQLRLQKLHNEIAQLAITSNELLTTTANTIGDAFDKTFRGVLDGSIKAKNAFAAFGKSVISTLQEIILKELKSQIIGMAFRGIGSLFGSTATFENSGFPYQLGSKLPIASANGNIFNSGNVVPFSRGGIPDIGNNMQYFPLANGGVGSLRENGKYEAIIPLSRDSTGQLGVKAEGNLANQQNNVYNINVNVSGATDKSNADEVGMKVATAIMVQIADARIANANKLGNQLKPLTAFG